MLVSTSYAKPLLRLRIFFFILLGLVDGERFEYPLHTYTYIHIRTTLSFFPFFVL